MDPMESESNENTWSLCRGFGSSCELEKLRLKSIVWRDTTDDVRGVIGVIRSCDSCSSQNGDFHPKIISLVLFKSCSQKKY